MHLKHETLADLLQDKEEQERFEETTQARQAKAMQNFAFRKNDSIDLRKESLAITS